MEEPTIVKHEYGKPPATFNFSVERNTKGFNFSISVMGAETEQEATDLRFKALAQVKLSIQEANEMLQGGL